MCSEDNADVHDIELLQYISVDCAKLKRLLQGRLRSEPVSVKADLHNFMLLDLDIVKLVHLYLHKGACCYGSYYVYWFRNNIMC